MIVFPMAGLSSRFAAAGYDRPKYELTAHGHSLFAYAVAGFARYFESQPFLFVYRGDESVAEFIRSECAKLGVADVRLAHLEASTDGQAETVLLGLAQAAVADDEPIVIFNIDTFRPNLTLPSLAPEQKGWLEVFVGAGEGWSFVRPAPDQPDVALETTEKLRISDLCCTGLYIFAQAGDFRRAYAAPPPAKSEAERRERYVAPLYNSLIGRGEVVAYGEIPLSDVIFCGVPAEYEAFLQAPEQAARLLPLRR